MMSRISHLWYSATIHTGLFCEQNMNNEKIHFFHQRHRMHNSLKAHLLSFRKCLDGTFPWRCSVRTLGIYSEEKVCICYSFHLGWCTNVSIEYFLQVYIPLRQLLNEEKLSLCFDMEICHQSTRWKKKSQKDQCEKTTVPVYWSIWQKNSFWTSYSSICGHHVTYNQCLLI